jgi:hypothetical protein
MTEETIHQREQRQPSSPAYFTRSASRLRNLTAVLRSALAPVTIVSSTKRPVLLEATQLSSSNPLQP